MCVSTSAPLLLLLSNRNTSQFGLACYLWSMSVCHQAFLPHLVCRNHQRSTRPYTAKVMDLIGVKTFSAVCSCFTHFPAVGHTFKILQVFYSWLRLRQKIATSCGASIMTPFHSRNLWWRHRSAHSKLIKMSQTECFFVVQACLLSWT